jgi:mannosyltransferase
VLTVPVTYALGLRTVGERAALIGAGLLAVAPFHVYFSSEARAYALAAFLVTASTLALVDALESSRRRSWIVFAVATAAAVYTHYTTILVLAAQAGWVLWRRPARRRALLAALAGAVALYLPWLPSVESKPNLEGVAYFYPFTPREIARDLLSALPGRPLASLGEVPGHVWVGVFLAAIALAALRFGRELAAPARACATFLALLALATPLGLAAYSVVSTHIFAPRNLIASLPAFCLLVGALVASAGRRWSAALTVTLVAVFAVATLRSYGDDTRRPPWKETAAYVDAAARPRDPVVSGGLSPFRDPTGGDWYVDSLAIYLKRPHPLYPIPRPQAGWRRFAGARRLFVVIHQLSLSPARHATPRPGPSFRLVGVRTFPGAAGISVFTYAGTHPRTR